MRPIGEEGQEEQTEEPRLPPGYHLDLSDPDVWVLRCPHGEAVARFSALGATPEDIERAATEAYRQSTWSA